MSKDSKTRQKRSRNIFESQSSSEDDQSHDQVHRGSSRDAQNMMIEEQVLISAMEKEYAEEYGIIFKQITDIKKALNIYKNRQRIKQFIPVSFFNLNFGSPKPKDGDTQQDLIKRTKKVIKQIQENQAVFITLQEFELARQTKVWEEFVQSDWFRSRYSYRDFSRYKRQRIKYKYWNSTLVLVRNQFKIIQYYECKFVRGQKPFAICVCQTKTASGKNIKIVIASIHLNAFPDQMQERKIHLKALKRFNKKKFGKTLLFINGDFNFDYKATKNFCKDDRKFIRQTQALLDQYFDMQFEHSQTKNLPLEGTYKSAVVGFAANSQRLDRLCAQIYGVSSDKLKKIFKVQGCYRRFIKIKKVNGKLNLPKSTTDHQGILINATIYLKYLLRIM